LVVLFTHLVVLRPAMVTHLDVLVVTIRVYCASICIKQPNTVERVTGCPVLTEGVFDVAESREVRTRHPIKNLNLLRPLALKVN